MPTPHWPYGYVPTAQEWYDALFNQVGPQGEPGPTGPQGASAPAIVWLYSTETTDADPGSEYLRFDNATPALAGHAYVSNISLSGDVAAWLDSFGETGDAASRGQILFTKRTDPSVQMIVQVTGSIVDGTGYRKISFSVLSGGLPLLTINAQISVEWYARGPAPTHAQQIVTDTSAVVDAHADVVIINRADNALVTLTLPAVATWEQIPKTVIRWDAHGGDVLVVPDGAETIMGLSSWTLASYAAQGGGGSMTLIPVPTLSGCLVTK